MPTVNTSDNRYGVAQLIVAPTLAEGANYTTIASALTAASSGQTIFIRPGTYTEDLTLKAGVNLTAFGCDSSLNATGHVIISGNATLSTAGTVTISGIQLQTNSANCVTVSGSVASILNLNNCFIYCLNNTGISYSSSSASSRLNIINCTGDLGTTGIGFWSHSSAGLLSVSFSKFGNAGGSTTATTISAGFANYFYCSFFSPISFTGASGTTVTQLTMSTKTQNATCLTTANTAVITVSNCYFESGTASAVSVGAGTTVTMFSCTVSSSNTNAVTGAGSMSYAGIAYIGSQINNVTTQGGGTLSGSANTSPSAGFLGERIEATIAISGIALSNGIAKTVTSINLTAGIWDISSICVISGSLQTRIITSISATNNAIGSSGIGIDASDSPNSASGSANVTNVVPALRVVLSAAATYYLTAQVAFTGSASAGGRISATRVG